MTKQDVYSLSCLDKCTDFSSKVARFSSQNANSGYKQVEIEKKQNRNKTVFITHYGLYRFLQMPFGLRNALSTFQETMFHARSAVRLQCALVYQDDVVVFLLSSIEHIYHVKNVLTIFTTQR